MVKSNEENYFSQILSEIYTTNNLKNREVYTQNNLRNGMADSKLENEMESKQSHSKRRGKGK